MASTKTLTAKNLEALGPARLAELLMDIGAGDATIKRRLRLELAGASGATDVAREVRKRLAALAKARSLVERRQTKTLIADLSAQRNAIADVIARTDPDEALGLLWDFLRLGNATLYRCEADDSGVRAVFTAAARDIVAIAPTARMSPDALAWQVFEILRDDEEALYDDLIADLAATLGESGLRRLKALIDDYRAQTPLETPEDQREIIGYGLNGPLYATDFAAWRRKRIIRSALLSLAEALGDVDAYMAQYDDDARRIPSNAADIAQNFLSQGRAEEALAALDAADQRHFTRNNLDVQLTRLKVLEALGRAEDAQAQRWTWFADSLSATHLRAFLKGLPDFDDVEAEEKALALALDFPAVHDALRFLIDWPALTHANRLVLTRFAELNGDHYDVLTPAADALETRYPLAATLVRRAMIDFALERARYKRYPHAARHLMECESLAPRIADFGDHMNHHDYLANLEAQHGRKTGFWVEVP